MPDDIVGRLALWFDEIGSLWEERTILVYVPHHDFCKEISYKLAGHLELTGYEVTRATTRMVEFGYYSRAIITAPSPYAARGMGLSAVYLPGRDIISPRATKTFSEVIENIYPSLVCSRIWGIRIY